MVEYFRPLVQSDLTRSAAACPLAGGPLWFDQVEVLSRNAAPRIIPAQSAPPDWLDLVSKPRPALAGLSLDRPRIMGILNVTPDSFSDGGQHNAPASAVAHARHMVEAGADIIDVGGESTRPGAQTIEPEAEVARTQPVIQAIARELDVPISVDTRKYSVARPAVEAGATLVNDVSGFVYNPHLAPFCAREGLAVCVMHAKGDPQTMQNDPVYGDVVLDVFDFLEAQIAFLVETGVPASRILVDPGIGFGKTMAHNLALLNRLSLFHGLGCPILLGASRKKFIGTLSQAPVPEDRVPGSVAVALAGIRQGAQMVRVHDVTETRQAIDLWRAIQQGETYGHA